MAFLRRRPSDPQPGSEIRAFWSWWTSEGARTVAAAIDTRATSSIVDLLGAKVDAIDAELAWEVAPGVTSRHLLVVTAAGNPDVRATSRRWLLGAPPPDATWSFADVRQPVSDPDTFVFEIGGQHVDAASAVVSARIAGSLVNVSLHHPTFRDLDENTQKVVTFLLLDSVLGEEAVETWIGAVDVSVVSPLDPVPLRGLRSVVTDLREGSVDSDGNPKWSLLQGESPDGTPILASAQIPLRSATAPHLDTYVAVIVPFTDVTADGMPGPGSLDPLRTFEDAIGDALGSDGRVVAHQTQAGVRVLHAYVDGTTDAATRIKAVAGRWPQGRAEALPQADPGWDSVSHLRG